MKPVSQELLNILASRQFFVADLYSFTGGNLGNNVLRYCGGDLDVIANGAFFPASGQTGPYFDRKDNKARVHQKIGLEVDTLVMDVLPGTATVFGTPFLQAIHTGLFDGAELVLEKVYMPTYNVGYRVSDNMGNIGYGDTRAGTLRYFVGRVAEIDAGRSIATFSINSDLELLNLPLPLNLFQPGCVNNLGDASCLVNLSSYTTTGAVTQASANATIYASISGSFDTGTFDLGTIQFTSGVLNGLSQTIRQCVFGTPDTIYTVGFFPTAPNVGDAFNITYGCNKSPTDPNGCPKFSNLNQFRGMPVIPQPVTAT